MDPFTTKQFGLCCTFRAEFSGTNLARACTRRTPFAAARCGLCELILPVVVLCVCQLQAWV